MNKARPNGDSTRHITAACSAARTFDTLLRALERRQAKPLTVPDGRPAPRTWEDAPSPATVIADLAERVSADAGPPEPHAETWTLEDIAHAEAFIERQRKEKENEGLDIANTEGILPCGGMILPEDPPPASRLHRPPPRPHVQTRTRRKPPQRHPGDPENSPHPHRQPHPMKPHQDHPNMTQPADLLTGFIISLLTPFLVAGGMTDIDLARRTAAETIAAHIAANPGGQPIAIAQTVAFALTSIDNLRLSLPEDLSLSMKLKLRGNANALSRSSQHAAAQLETQGHTAEPALEPDPTELLETQPPEPNANPTDQNIDQCWAQAMKEVAAEFTAELPRLQPAQRRLHLARIGALSAIARTLARSDAPPLKSRLLGSTSLQT